MYTGTGTYEETQPPNANAQALAESCGPPSHPLGYSTGMTAKKGNNTWTGSWVPKPGPELPGPGPRPWVPDPRPRPSAWPRAWTRGPGLSLGPGPKARGLREIGKMQNPKGICALEKSAWGVPYARIDPSRRGVMTEAIFVLPAITRDQKT